MTHIWITNRLPTKADADRNGEVIVCNSPTFNLGDWEYEKYNRVTPGWPWRHTDFWTPPTPAPEPTPAAPELEQEPQPELTAMIPRRIVSIRRTVLDSEDFITDVVDDEGTAWWLRSDNPRQWIQFPQLPFREVPAR